MEIDELIQKYIPRANAEQAARFTRYCALLVEWNEKMNLTAITEPEEIVAKHFADSLLPMELIPKNARCIDVGTGAGFPGVPLMIMRPDLSMTLLDSLNKRLVFLETLLKELNLSARLVHARAEDAGRDRAHREAYDVALARAVASASALMEWTSPLVHVGGVSLFYKGPKADEELAAARRAAQLLHLTASLVDYGAPWGERRVMVVKKNAPTPKEYPRKAGTAEKSPL
ncbi:MAG TPA: 16S rRNA (guanine(527)-N(7))-methyltransferase RsmG [Clostridia bacterium]|nr:16S rRNA (guanine(527)-N(7))-methyltransferase RsmG [Clostridia bacterium]